MAWALTSWKSWICKLVNLGEKVEFLIISDLSLVFQLNKTREKCFRALTALNEGLITKDYKNNQRIYLLFWKEAWPVKAELLQLVEMEKDFRAPGKLQTQ